MIIRLIRLEVGEYADSEEQIITKVDNWYCDIMIVKLMGIIAIRKEWFYFYWTIVVLQISPN